MKSWLQNILAIGLISTITFNTYASTPSNYDPQDAVMDGDEYLEFVHELRGYDDQEDEVDYDQYIATDSSFSSGTLESIKDLLLDIKNQIVPDDQEDSFIDRASGPVLLAFRSGDNYHKNVVVYHGTFNNTDADLVIPYSAYSSLDIINGYLVNLGSSSVTGRLLYNGDLLDPDDYETYDYILGSIYSNPSSVYSYGSFNYQRHYYVSNGRIVTQDTYGKFYVDDVDVYYTASERQYYILMIILLFMGVSFLWIRRRL